MCVRLGSLVPGDGAAELPSLDVEDELARRAIGILPLTHNHL